MKVSSIIAVVLFVVSAMSCDSDSAPGEVQLVPVDRTASGSVTLGPEEGFLVAGATFQRVGVASTAGSDLLAFKAGTSLQLKPGHPDGRLVVNQPEGGMPTRTANLDEVPYEAPSTMATAAFLGNPKVGYSFTLLANGTDGYGRFRVTEEPDANLGADGIRVTLEYDVTWTELVPAD